MITYEVKLKLSEEIANGTMAFHFSKPSGFTFKPGQAIDLVLINHESLVVEGGRHTFSLVSAPFEDELIVATRMRDSAYKRALHAALVGSIESIEGPFGSLTLHNDHARSAVFLAGGIGITPFMSILRQATQDNLPHHLLLLYSNRRPEDAAFLDELQKLEQRNAKLRVVATMTKMSQSDRQWNGPTGFLDETLIKTCVSDLPNPIYYLAGPPGMVEAMRETLDHMDVNDDDIRSEEFYGY